MPERTLIILKPDAVDRRLTGRIIDRFEQKGLQILGMKFTVVAPEVIQKHYDAHREKPFYDSLVGFMTGGPVVLMALGGENAIATARTLMGATAAHKAEPGTIRGDFGLSASYNLVHGSDSPEAAERELELFFKPEELVEWRPSGGQWFE